HWMDAATGKFTKVIPCQNWGQPSPQNNVILMVLSGDAGTLAYVDDQENDIVLVDVATGKQLRRIPRSTLFTQDVRLYDVPFELPGDGKRLLAGGSRGAGTPMPLVWVDTTTGQRLHTLVPPEDATWGKPRLTPDDKHVVVQAMGGKGKQRLYFVDTATWELSRV